MTNGSHVGKLFSKNRRSVVRESTESRNRWAHWGWGINSEWMTTMHTVFQAVLVMLSREDNLKGLCLHTYMHGKNDPQYTQCTKISKVLWGKPSPESHTSLEITSQASYHLECLINTSKYRSHSLFSFQSCHRRCPKGTPHTKDH